MILATVDQLVNQDEKPVRQVVQQTFVKQQ